MTIPQGTERIKAYLELFASEHGVQATRESRLFGQAPRHATDVVWRTAAGTCLIRFEVDSRSQQEQWNWAKLFGAAMDEERLPAHFVFVRFDNAARPGALRPVTQLVAGIPLPPGYMHPITVDHKSPSLEADLQRFLQTLLTVIGPTGKEIDDVFTLLKPYQLLVCAGRLDLAVSALNRRICLHKAPGGSAVQLPLHVITLARLLQQAGWLAEARRYVGLAGGFGRDAVPAPAWDFLSSIDWKLRVAEENDWGRKAALLNAGERRTSSLCAPFIWRQALAETRMGRLSLATEHLKRYQDHVGSGTDDHVGSGTNLYKQSVSSFVAAQERLLAGDVGEALIQSGLLADVEVQMFHSPDEQPTASLNALVAAEALRAMVLCARGGEVSDRAVELLQELLAAGDQCGVGVHSESVSDIALPWPRAMHVRESGDRCMPPRMISLRDPTRTDRVRQLLLIHSKLDELQRAL